MGAGAPPNAGIGAPTARRGIRGRLVGLTKLGRAEWEAERQALAERFENTRSKEHYELERLKELQVEVKQADRMTRAREIKRSRLEHLEERQKLARLHQTSHEFKIDVSTYEMKRAVDYASRHSDQAPKRRG